MKMVDGFCQSLTPEELEMAECLLRKYIDGFARSKENLSITNVDQHRMTMSSGERVKLGPHRIPLAKCQALKCELVRMLILGVIEPSKRC